MKASKFAARSAVLAIVALLGISGVAAAQPGYGCGGPMYMTNEQAADLQQLHRSHREKMEPLMQQRFAKLAEMDHLFAAGAKPDDARVQAARKELRDIDAKLYAAEADMLRQMGGKGLPYRGRHGMRGGWGGGWGGCPGMGGHGYGHGGYGPGMGMGRGMNGYGPGYGCGSL